MAIIGREDCMKFGIQPVRDSNPNQTTIPKTIIVPGRDKAFALWSKAQRRRRGYTFVKAVMPPMTKPINKATNIRFTKNPFVNPSGDQVMDKMRITRKTTIPFPEAPIFLTHFEGNEKGTLIEWRISKLYFFFFPNKKLAKTGNIVKAIITDATSANVLV